MQNLMLLFRVSGNDLLLEYETKTERCSWSIFDTGGIEKCTGVLTGNPPHRISLSCLSPDLYQLCVIDGDMLHNTRFRVS